MKHMIGTKTSALRRAVALCMELICLCGCALPLLTSCKEISGKVTTLYVYNWGEYISVDDGTEGVHIGRLRGFAGFKRRL